MVRLTAHLSEWEPNRASSECRVCYTTFGFFSNRKHHCRQCGKLVCDACSLARVRILPTDADEHRVCNNCANPSHHRVISIAYADIPVYLHRSKFYQNLSPNDPDEIEVPFRCMKWDDSVTSSYDLVLLLRVVEFWGFDELPLAILHYCMTHNSDVWNAVLEVSGSPQMDLLRAGFIDHPYARQPLLQARRVRRTDIVRYLIVFGPKSKRDTCGAAGEGDLVFLTLLHESGFPWHVDTCEAAAAGGHLECLRYAYQNGCPWSPQVCSKAVQREHMACLVYARLNGCPWDDGAVREAMKHRSPYTLRCLLAAHAPIPRDACTNVAHAGNTTNLRLLHEYGAAWSVSTTAAAAVRNHISCLKYLHEQGCPWDERTTEGAARFGCLQTLRYALENGCSFHVDIVMYAASAGSVSCLKLLVEEQGLLIEGWVLSAAIAIANLECVRYLVDAGCPFPSHWEDVSFSVHCDDELLLKCIKYAVDHGWQLSTNIRERLLSSSFFHCSQYIMYEWHGTQTSGRETSLWCSPSKTIPGDLQTIFNRASEVGDFQTMRDALRDDGGIQLHRRHVVTASASGRFDCVMLLISAGCLYDDTCTEAAARGGHFEVFQHLVRNGCSCNTRTILQVVASDWLPYLQLLFEFGHCETSSDLFETALRSASHECMRYLINTMNVTVEGCVYVEHSDITDPDIILSDDAMCMCLTLAVDAGWKWNTSFMQYLRDCKCIKSREYLLQRQRFCNTGGCVQFTHSLGDHVPCALYANEHWSTRVVFSSRNMSASTVRETCSRAWYIVGSYGCVECGKVLYDQWVPGEEKGIIAAARSGQHHFLRFLLEHGCAADETVAAVAAGKGHEQCLNVLHRFGCAFDISTANAAAHAGNRKTLRYAIVVMRCPVDNHTVKLAAAAESGSLECVKCLIKNYGLRLVMLHHDGAVFGAALLRADVECVYYLLRVGCPFHNFCIDPESVAIPVHKDLQFLQCVWMACQRGWLIDCNLVYFVHRSRLPMCVEYFKRLCEKGVRRLKEIPRAVEIGPFV